MQKDCEFCCYIFDKVHVLLRRSFTGDPSGLSPTWNDEDERDFYENLPDLKATMPSMAYKDSLAESAVAVNGEQQSSEESDMSILDAVIKADSELTLNVVAKDPSEPSQSPCRQTSAKGQCRVCHFDLLGLLLKGFWPALQRRH